MKISLYRSLSAEQVEALQALSRQVVKQVQLRRNLARYKRVLMLANRLQRRYGMPARTGNLHLLPLKLRVGRLFQYEQLSKLKQKSRINLALSRPSLLQPNRILKYWKTYGNKRCSPMSIIPCRLCLKKSFRRTSRATALFPTA